MPTSAIAGKDGSISGLNGASEVTEFDVELETDALPATSLESGGDREKIEGLRDWSGSFTAIGDAPTRGAAAAASFSTASTTYSGAIIITNVTVTNDVEDRVEYAAEFEGNGPVTIA